MCSPNFDKDEIELETEIGEPMCSPNFDKDKIELKTEIGEHKGSPLPKKTLQN
jgi:hypothetical protein